jgi:hypothetical protein
MTCPYRLWDPVNTIKGRLAIAAALMLMAGQGFAETTTTTTTMGGGTVGRTG